MARLLLLLRSNWISAFGAILTTLSFMGFAITWIYLTLHGAGHGPYMGMFAFVLLPVLFVFGLVIIPVGLWVYRKQLTQRMEMLMNKPFRLLRFVGLLTLINLAVAGTGGYEAMKYMDSPQFCGTLCHEVMSPTFDVYVDSPHARVECVECHIGRGATSFVKAKMSGLRRVFAVMFDTSRRPIPAPVHDMAPASDTCEHCHWSDRFIGDRLVVRKHYQEDEAVTPMTSGEASGFWSAPCRTAPATPRAEPTRSASTSDGTRMPLTIRAFPGSTVFPSSVSRTVSKGMSTVP